MRLPVIAMNNVHYLSFDFEFDFDFLHVHTYIHTNANNKGDLRIGELRTYVVAREQRWAQFQSIMSSVYLTFYDGPYRRVLLLSLNLTFCYLNSSWISCCSVHYWPLVGRQIVLYLFSLVVWARRWATTADLRHHRSCSAWMPPFDCLGRRTSSG